MFKKLVAIAMASTMTAAMAITTFAASGLNDQEQKIITALENAGVPSSQIEKVKAELIKDGVDITATEADNAIANIDEAKKIVADAGITSVEELKANQEVLNQVVAKANTAAKAVGYADTISVSSTGAVVSSGTTGIPTTTVSNTDSNKDSSTLKTTGVDFSTTATVVAGLGLSVAGVAIASKKRVSANA
jgi:hypothetical protein